MNSSGISSSSRYNNRNYAEAEDGREGFRRASECQAVYAERQQGEQSGVEKRAQSGIVGKLHPKGVAEEYHVEIFVSVAEHVVGGIAEQGGVLFPSLQHIAQPKIEHAEKGREKQEIHSRPQHLRLAFFHKI